MPLTTCDPCCDPEQFAKSQESFRSSELRILCQILGALGGGSGTYYEWVTLCDPGNSNAPVLLQIGYTSSGAISGVTAFNPDGTPWVGTVSTLKDCSTSNIQMIPVSGELTGASFTTNYQTILNPGGQIVSLHLHSTLSQNVSIRINSGPDMKLLSAIGTVTLDLGEKHRMNSGLVEAKAYDGTAITGTLVAWGYR